MAGEPVTEILNPCPWSSEHSEDPVLLATCLADWKQVADDPDFETRFCTGPLEFECAAGFHPDRSSAGRHGGVWPRRE